MAKSWHSALVLGLFSCALAAPARAQSVTPSSTVKPSEPAGDPRVNVDVRPSPTWSATDQIDRPVEGHATMHLRLSLPGDYGTWAYVPSRFGSNGVPVVGGDVALTSQLSLVLEGAGDPFDHRYSGAAIGMRYNFMPLRSPLQLSLGGGVLQDLAGARGTWGQFAISEELGRLHLAAALRGSELFGAMGREQLLAGSAGVAYDLLPVRLGLEYAFERNRETRSALLPWVEMSTPSRRVSFRAGPVFQINGANAFPARASIAGNF